MQYYIIKESDIELCSKSGIVACWDDELELPIIAATDYSAKLFSDCETVER